MCKKSYLNLSAGRVVAFIMAMMFAGTAFSADFYSVRIKQVVPRAENNGDVFVQVEPDPERETRFTERSRLIIDGTSPGANKLMSVITAGLLLDKRVTVLVDNVPSFENPQVIQSAGLAVE